MEDVDDDGKISAEDADVRDDADMVGLLAIKNGVLESKKN